jgi:ParB/RepB/Spo0J family partition protein
VIKTPELLIDIEKILPNKWNPNVMQKEEYEALKQDMHLHGVNGVDPILVSLKGVYELPVPIPDLPAGAWDKAFKVKGYVIVDGEHRWRAAKELGWKQIRATSENIREEDAKALCYRRNRERGTIDPFKEAALFKTEIDVGLTQAKIAGKYGIEQGTVSHRLSLLKLEPEIIEKVESMPRGIITPSHLEPLATLHPDDRKDLARSLIREAKDYGRVFSVREMTQHAENMKRRRDQQEALEKALETAKYPTCPVCKKKAFSINHKGLPWVNCNNYHSIGAWNLETGKTEYKPEIHEEKTLTGETRKVESSVLRSVHTVKELKDLFIKHAKEVVPKVDIQHVKVSGKLDGSSFSFDLDNYGKMLHISVAQSGVYRSFTAEEHKYRTGEVTCIHAGSPGAVEEVREFIDNAFNGKLVIESKRLKKTKGTVLESEEPLESEKLATTENPEDSLANEEIAQESLPEE